MALTRMCEGVRVIDLVIEPVTDTNMARAVAFLAESVTGTEIGAREHLADHADGQGASLLALDVGRPVGIVTVRWTSDYPGFQAHDAPLVHQVAVDEAARRQGVATALMDAIESLARRRGHNTIGTTVGLADSYGPAQRLYAKRGYLPDGRGACRGQDPVPLGASLTMDHDIILWLTKALER